ncbi:hypothetical protein BWI92_11225 [Flectobacillus sp. BAB-3569]|nr:hypothetical protein BWI92_11225 [Flectobacillus sp. BAB-3569]
MVYFILIVLLTHELLVNKHQQWRKLIFYIIVHFDKSFEDLNYKYPVSKKIGTEIFSTDYNLTNNY